MEEAVEVKLLRDFCSAIWKNRASFCKSASLQVLVALHPCRSVQAGFHFRQSKLGYSTGYQLLFSASAGRTCPAEF